MKDLRTHSQPYVTIAELAEYWLVGRKQLYKQIEAGTLGAIRLGPRLLRIRTADALEFEARAKIHPPSAAHRPAKVEDSSPRRAALRTARR